MSRAQEIMQKHYEKQAAQAEELVGKWVMGNSTTIDTALMIVPVDDDYSEAMEKAKKLIFKVKEVSRGSITSPNIPDFNSFSARYVQPASFSGDDPTPEEVEMYKMLGYVFLDDKSNGGMCGDG